ncbi:SDR family NAD(P)-dependent oxidoreductase [Naumannella sp. ID2617S]|nr:SDR family NAD(P)-dependent oxidoreductase [Naumannella sp. ID2617S]
MECHVTAHPARHVLVTGATSGIGAEVARLLSAQGFRVSVAGRRTELVPPGVTPVSLDLTDEASIHRAHAEATAESGPVEVLVNAAGLGQFGAIEDVTLAQARRQLEVNVLGQLELIRRCLPGMRAAGRGRVVMVSSLAGEFAAPMCGWYHASKFASRRCPTACGWRPIGTASRWSWCSPARSTRPGTSRRCSSCARPRVAGRTPRRPRGLRRTSPVRRCGRSPQRSPRWPPPWSGPPPLLVPRPGSGSAGVCGWRWR